MPAVSILQSTDCNPSAKRLIISSLDSLVSDPIITELFLFSSEKNVLLIEAPKTRKKFLV